MAECHPVGFQWVMEAKARGATIIHVDPRFTRTSAVADLHVPIRAGSRHRLPRRADQPRPQPSEKYFRDYVVAYTNAADDRWRRTSATPRTSTACSPATTAEPRTYDPASWQYEGVDGAGRRRAARPGIGRAARRAARSREGAAGRATAAAAPALIGDPHTRPDPAAPAVRLPDPQAALRPLHPRTGPGGLRHPAGAVRAGGRGADPQLRPRAHQAFAYAVGWTHHTVGAQYIRAAAILQPLLGNIGRPGRRDHGAARSCQHPGLHRHPDTVQPPARLHPDAARPRAPDPRRLRGRRRRHRRVSGETWTPTPSACSRPGGATRPPPTTTSASTTCPG